MQNSKLSIRKTQDQRQFKIKNPFLSLISYLLSPQRGFTLIELLIVISVIGILASGVLSILNPQKLIQQANDAKRKSDLSLIQKALEQAYQDNNGKYPSNHSSGIYIIVSPQGSGVDWGSPWHPYIEVMPKDPNSTKSYAYVPTSDGQAYRLYASLDLVQDSQLCKADGAVCDGVPADASCGSGICNYGVASPNVSP